jgi:Uma2 family endonuclease
MRDRLGAGMLAIQPDSRYTVSDYLNWPSGERWELIKGVPYSMSPAPSVPHQRIVGDAYASLRDYTANHPPCEPFIAPTDLFLPHDNTDDTVVQPDVMVVCDPDKVSEKGVTGPPDLVIEVLSDATAYKDLSDKKLLYETVGVREYWTVNRATKTVLVWRLADQTDGNRRFAPVKEYQTNEPVDSSVLRGFVWKVPHT